MRNIMRLGFWGLLAAAAFVLLQHERRQRERSMSELRQQVAALAETTPVPPRYIFAPRLSREAHVDRSVDPQPKGEPPPRESSKRESPEAKSPEIEMAERHAAYEQAFLNDQVDGEWAERMKLLTNEKLPALLPEGSSVRSLECKAKLCRLEIAHKDRESYWKFLNAAFLTPPKTLWNGLVYTMPLNDDPTEGLMVTYLAREGLPLPTFEN